MHTRQEQQGFLEEEEAEEEEEDAAVLLPSPSSRSRSQHFRRSSANDAAPELHRITRTRPDPL